MAHELPAETTPPCAGTPEQIRLWRKDARRILIERRKGLDPSVRSAMAEQARQRITESIDFSQYDTVGFYWPIEAEIDCQNVIRRLVAAGRTVALPVVIEKNKPLEFWRWQPGDKMVRGLWDIPVPAERVVVQPDALVIPLVGFDVAGYRMGYGGGYYDRTIAAAPRKPFCIGLGFSLGMLSSICPQPYDIRMDVVVTEKTVTNHILKFPSPP